MEFNFQEGKPSGLAALGTVHKGRKVLCVWEAQQGSPPPPGAAGLATGLCAQDALFSAALAFQENEENGEGKERGGG